MASLKYYDSASGTYKDLYIPGAPGAALPPGGTDGQVLTKQSSTDGDAGWETAVAVGDYVSKSGDTMTGDLTVASAGITVDSPVNSFFALDRGSDQDFAQFEFRTAGNQDFVLGAIGAGANRKFRLYTNGGEFNVLEIDRDDGDIHVLNGADLILHHDPAAALEAATKQYVDSHFFLNAGSGITPSSLPAAYPQGISTMLLTASDTTGSTWPIPGSFAYVITQRIGTGTNGAVQLWCRLTTGGSPTGIFTAVKMRGGNSSGWNTQWVDIGGPDTLWKGANFTGTGWTQTVPIALRRIGRQVFIRGRLANAAFAAAAIHTNIATLPADIPAPAYSLVYPMAAYGTTAYNRSFLIDTSGNIAVNTSLANGNYYDFTGSYVIPDATD